MLHSHLRALRMTQSRDKPDWQSLLPLQCGCNSGCLCQENTGQSPLTASILAVPAGRTAQWGPLPASLEAWSSSRSRNRKATKYEFGKGILMINYSYNFKIIAIELVASERNRLIKNPASEVTGEKKRDAKWNLHTEAFPKKQIPRKKKYLHNLKKTWH